MLPKKYIFTAVVVCIFGIVFCFFSGKSQKTATQISPEISQFPFADNNQREKSKSKIALPIKIETKILDNQKLFSSTMNLHNANKTVLNISSKENSSSPTTAGTTGQNYSHNEYIIAFLSDPTIDEVDKIQKAKNWTKPGSREETLSLVQLMINSHEIGQDDLKDQLLQVLAGVDSNEPTEALLSIIKGEVPEITFEELPKELKYAIQKAIRLNPDTQWTGKVLAESSGYQASEKTIENLKAVNHPTMLYYLAQEADQRGEIEEVRQIVSSLISIEAPESLEMIIGLGQDNVLSVDDASQAAFDWAASHNNYLKQDQYESYLSEPDADSVVRSLAASALAASNDPNSALTSLKKAYDHETDKNTRYFYEEAIDSLSQRVEVPNE